MDSLKGLRIACYARFSSDAQRDSSIDSQVRLVREYVERAGGSIPAAIVFADRAVSGTKVTRHDYDRLLQLIQARQLDVVATESADRLSRDLGDADRLWKLCRFHGVRLICVSDGIDSASRGSRLQFGVKSLMSDEYIDDLASKTRRGLRDRFADKKANTGGLPLGYRSVAVWGSKREPEYFRIEIDPETGAIIVRIFKMYVRGESYLNIASTLNAEGIRPPRAKNNSPTPKYWRKGTIASILANAKYIGHFTFGVKQWGRDPVTRRRRYTTRTDDVLEDFRPELAIVSKELWDAAQARKRAVATRKSSGRRTAHPFSGLLFCFACGSRMVHAGGSTRQYYQCNGAHSGDVCSNRALLREDLLVEAAIRELRAVLCNEELWRDLQAEMQDGVRSLKATAGSERLRLRDAVAKQDVEIQRLLNFIATTDIASVSYDAVRTSLDAATAKKKEAEAALGSLGSPLPEPPKLPTVEELRASMTDIETHLCEDPTGFREFMRSQFLEDGRIVMEPVPDGSYRAHSKILPLWIAGRRKSKGPGEPEPSGPLAAVSCGGRI